MRLPNLTKKRLKKLNEILRLPRLGVPNIRLSYDAPDLDASIPVKDEFLPEVYPPFRSPEEVLIWGMIQTYDNYWQPMVPLFGGPGVEGGTEIDFYNQIRRIALYADGPPHLLPGVAARDLSLRKAVQATGLKVLSFSYRTAGEVNSRFPGWYRDNIGD